MGKHTGTYWWNHHRRGEVEAGIAVRDYRLSAVGAPDA